MNLPRIYVRDRIYIPIKSIVDVDSFKDKYLKHMFKQDANCLRCEYKADRPCAVCESCENYQGSTRLWAAKAIQGQHYIGVPVGDKLNVERKSGILFKEHRVVDKRQFAPLHYKIKFLVELRPHQKKLVDDFMKWSYGMLEAPPRTGKTLLMLKIGLLLGQRMVLIANQHEYLQQFLWHIEGNEEEGIPKCTNLPEIQQRAGKKLYGFPKTAEDFENMQFMVMTYQQFMSEVKGKNRFKKLSQNIGTVAVDEAHRIGATTFSKTMNAFYCRYRFGVTGTVERKDKRHLITKIIMGPVVARTKIEAVVPKVFIKDTGISLRNDPKLWVYKMKALCNSKPRNQLIVERCIKDVKAGHSVVIPLMFTKHIHQMVRDINEAYGSDIAEAFVGGGAAKHKLVRQAILARAKSGETKVIVGTRSLLQLGLNVPRWSCIYTVIPISNKPNYLQETSRVRTPMDGKRSPIIRLFYDSAMPASVACARNCFNHMKEFKYAFSKDENTQTSISFILAAGSRNRRGADDDSEFQAQRTMDFDEETTSFGKAGRR